MLPVLYCIHALVLPEAHMPRFSFLNYDVIIFALASPGFTVFRLLIIIGNFCAVYIVDASSISMQFHNGISVLRATTQITMGNRQSKFG